MDFKISSLRNLEDKTHFYRHRFQDQCFWIKSNKIWRCFLKKLRRQEKNLRLPVPTNITSDKRRMSTMTLLLLMIYANLHSLGTPKKCQRPCFALLSNFQFPKLDLKEIIVPETSKDFGTRWLCRGHQCSRGRFQRHNNSRRAQRSKRVTAQVTPRRRPRVHLYRHKQWEGANIITNLNSDHWTQMYVHMYKVP